MARVSESFTSSIMDRLQEKRPRKGRYTQPKPLHIPLPWTKKALRIAAGVSVVLSVLFIIYLLGGFDRWIYLYEARQCDMAKMVDVKGQDCLTLWRLAGY